MNNLIQILRIAQPTAFINMMPDSAGYQIIFIRIGTLNQKFRHAISHRCFFDMLPQRPPAVIVHLFKITLRTFKQRYILFHPFRSLCIRNGLGYILIFHTIEIICIMAKIRILQNSSSRIFIHRRGFHIGDTVFS